MADFRNPFRPGAGHAPPYLAGRQEEKEEFLRLLDQDVILENLILTGLRGVGKTVLMDSFKPPAIGKKWLWAGTDLSESTTVSEESIALRLLTDLSVLTSTVVVSSRTKHEIGYLGRETKAKQTLNYGTLTTIYQHTPGLASDKLKATLEFAWASLRNQDSKGIVFAYDEAQNLADQAAKEQYPLSLLLDVFQSLQKKGLPLMLLLTGLPTLFPKLVETRTYTERMFHVLFLDRLSPSECREAILRPIEDASCPLKLSQDSVTTIVNLSGGYPYFIQFICREVYDAFIQKMGQGEPASIPTTEILRKLDSDFFAGRWARATDRQRELLGVIATLDHCDSEFTVKEIVEKSRVLLENGFSNSHVNQMLAALGTQGLVYKNRHGRYSFAVPLLGKFIQRQTAE